jgi:hypothetical protein
LKIDEKINIEKNNVEKLWMGAKNVTPQKTRTL